MFFALQRNDVLMQLQKTISSIYCFEDVFRRTFVMKNLSWRYKKIGQDKSGTEIILHLHLLNL
jgi:hypothetical protein